MGSKAYRDGGVAFRDGKRLSDCPKSLRFVRERIDWARGWTAAFFQSKATIR
jgi:hypothetical protein